MPKFFGKETNKSPKPKYTKREMLNAMAELGFNDSPDAYTASQPGNQSPSNNSQQGASKTSPKSPSPQPTCT